MCYAAHRQLSSFCLFDFMTKGNILDRKKIVFPVIGNDYIGCTMAKWCKRVGYPTRHTRAIQNRTSCMDTKPSCVVSR